MLNTIWYSNLMKPVLSPPNWVFAPVWTFLYISIFASLAFYINAYSENKILGYTYFVLQMMLNIIWTPVFFGLKSISGGLIIILLLNIFVFLTLFEFFKASKFAGIILLPYFLWLLFATYLNIGYLILN